MDKNNENGSLELYCLRGSPFSRRVVWALRILQVPYQKTFHETFTGEFYLRWRLNRWNPSQLVTVPVAFVHPPPSSGGRMLTLEHGFDIVLWADRRRGQDINNNDDSSTTSHRKELIPDVHLESIQKFCQKADEMLQIGRALFLYAVQQDASLLVPFLPTCLRNLGFITTIIVLIGNTFFKMKYRAMMDGNLDRIRAILEDVQKHLMSLKKQQKEKENKDAEVYLVGGQLTLADIYIIVAVDCFTSIRPDPALHPQRPPIERACQFPIDKEYPELFAWASAVTSIVSEPCPPFTSSF